VDSLTWFQLRDRLLAAAPLDAKHVRAVNAAELKYWESTPGMRVGWSDELLGFDCGGQQWVLEVAFPTGTLAKPSYADLDFVQGVLADIKKLGVAAPCPIEQRWTSTSKSKMSPASAEDADTVHSWVGIIMYLPTDDPKQRADITAAFKEYGARVMARQGRAAGATEHWAKIELPATEEGRAEMRARVAKRFPVEEFNRARAALDPKNVLANDLIDGVFGVPAAAA